MDSRPGPVLTGERRSGEGRASQPVRRGFALRVGVAFAVLAADRPCRPCRRLLRSSSTRVGAPRACGIIDPAGVLWLGRRLGRGGAGVPWPGVQPGQGIAGALWPGMEPGQGVAGVSCGPEGSLVRAVPVAAAAGSTPGAWPGQQDVPGLSPGTPSRICPPLHIPAGPRSACQPQAWTAAAGGPRRDGAHHLFHVEPRARAAGAPVSYAQRSPLAKAPELV